MQKRCPICARSFPLEARSCPEHELPLVETLLEAPDTSDGTLTGTVLDRRYLLGPLAGKGGMGTVYEAENLRIGRRVAVKVLHKELHVDPKMRVRLFREVQATCRVSHPNVVEIYDYGEDSEAGAFLVMEYLDGKSLAAVLRENGRLPIDYVLKVAIQVTSALAATHSAGLIHRDLKPSNVLILPDGTAKILDFGLVKAFERNHDEFLTITTGGIAFGTPWYMSPEQAAFQTLDPRSDLYSLGVVLYELLTGQPPFNAKNPVDLLEAQRYKQPPLPSQLDSPVQLPTSVELMILKLLKKGPDERHQSVMELMDDLYAIADELSIDVSNAAARIDPEMPPLPPQAVGEGTEMNTEAMTAAFWPPSHSIDPAALALANVDTLVERVAKQLQAAIPRYRTEKRSSLEREVRKVVEVSIEALSGEEPKELPEPLRLLADDRSEKSFTVIELLGALMIGLSEGRFMLQPTVESLESFIEMQKEIDHRLIPLHLKLVDYFFSRYNQRQVRLNEMLGRRNDELQRLRHQLSDQLRNTTSQLADLERLKARVTDNISSGLMLVERGTHNVLMFNKAMERLSGVSASDVLQRPFEDVVHFVEGLPLHEFLEQLRLHGEVGLRKLQLMFANNAHRSVYVRGQTFYGPDKQPMSTLFIVDDVTEREQIIESFSRYVTKDVVDRVLHRSGNISPVGQKKHAVLLACGIRDFRRVVDKLDTAEVTALLNNYIRTVADVIFQHGGVVDSVVGDAILCYFTGINAKSCVPAIEAAIGLCKQLETQNAARDSPLIPSTEVGIGIHSGDVLVLNIGGERRMVHTVVGEAAVVAQALQDVASGGEILISQFVRERCGSGYPTESGPYVSVKNQAEAVEAHRVVWRTQPANPVADGPDTQVS